MEVILSVVPMLSVPPPPPLLLFEPPPPPPPPLPPPQAASASAVTAMPAVATGVRRRLVDTDLIGYLVFVRESAQTTRGAGRRCSRTAPPARVSPWGEQCLAQSICGVTRSMACCYAVV